MRYNLEIFIEKKRVNPSVLAKREYILSISDSFNRDLKAAFLNKDACQIIGSLFIYDYDENGSKLLSSQQDVFQNEMISFGIGVSINQKIASLALKFDRDLKSPNLAYISLLSKVSSIAAGRANTTMFSAM